MNLNGSGIIVTEKLKKKLILPNSELITLISYIEVILVIIISLSFFIILHGHASEALRLEV